MALLNAFIIVVGCIASLTAIFKFIHMFTSNSSSTGVSLAVILFCVALVIMTLLAFGYINLGYSPIASGATQRPATTATPRGPTIKTPSPAPTSTAGNTPSPTPISTEQQLYQQVTGGVPTLSLLNKDQDQNDWITSSFCSFQNEQYHVAIPSPTTPQGGVHYCFFKKSLTGSNIGDNMALQVKMTISKGTTGGIILRSTAASENNIYSAKKDLVAVDTASDYELNLEDSPNCDTGNTTSFCGNDLLPAGPDAERVLTIIIKDGNIYFFVNGQFIAKKEHNRTGGSYIGLFTYYNKQAGDTAFYDMRIWQVQ